MLRWLLGGKVRLSLVGPREGATEILRLLYVTAYGFMHGVMNTDK